MAPDAPCTLPHPISGGPRSQHLRLSGRQTQERLSQQYERDAPTWRPAAVASGSRGPRHWPEGFHRAVVGSQGGHVVRSCCAAGPSWPLELLITRRPCRNPASTVKIAPTAFVCQDAKVREIFFSSPKHMGFLPKQDSGFRSLFSPCSINIQPINARSSRSLLLSNISLAGW